MGEKIRDGSINVRVNKQMREKANSILWQYGLTIGDAVNILLSQIVRVNGFPFDLRPNAETQVAIDQVKVFEQTRNAGEIVTLIEATS